MPNGFITHSERQKPQRSAAITHITHPQISFAFRPVGRTIPSSPCGRKNSPHIPVEYGTTTPIPSWPVLTQPPSARTSVRVRDLNSGGRESGTQLSLSRAYARPLGGRLKPGHGAERPSVRKASREGAKVAKNGDPSHTELRARSALSDNTAGASRQRGHEPLGDLGGSSFFLRVSSRLRVRPLIEPRD